jgi:hypothetical protein
MIETRRVVVLVTKIKVNGRSMYVCETDNDKDGKSHIGASASYADYCMERADVHAGCQAMFRVSKYIGEVDNVVELFGGCGWHSISIQKICKPNNHIILDCDANCVASIRKSFPKLSCFKVDSFKAVKKLNDWDWVHCDFNNFTINKCMNNEYGDILEHVFDASNRYVTITDSAIFGIVRFEKNRLSYANSIGMDPGDWRDYYRAASEWYFDYFGYSIVYVISFHRMAAYYILAKGSSPFNGADLVEESGKAKVELIKKWKE